MTKHASRSDVLISSLHLPRMMINHDPDLLAVNGKHKLSVHK